MAKWIIKAALQRSFSLFPNPEAINRLFQKYLTGQDKLNDTKFENKLLHASDHLRFLKKYSPGIDTGKIKCLELGTGQFPIVPIYYFLHGMNDIVSIDIISFMTVDRIKNTLDYFLHYQNRFPEKFEKYLSAVDENRWKEMQRISQQIDSYKSVQEVLAAFSSRILIQDARRTDFADATFDFITSNNTFEHIYPEILEGILKEFYRILKPGGVMSHFIDMTDHFAHFDSQINIYNFLKFSPRAWRMIDNEILPQSRLRLRDYEEMYHRLGIPVTEKLIWLYNAELLDTISIHQSLKGYSREELAVVHVYITSLKRLT